MKRVLLQSNTFIRVAKRMLRKKPALAPDVQEALERLEKDAFHPYLKTHKLIGSLEGSLACSAGYDLRIIFSFVKHNGKEPYCSKLLEPTKKCIDNKTIRSVFSLFPATMLLHF